MNNPYQVTRTDVDDVGPAIDRGEKPTPVSVAVVMLWLALIIQLAGLVWVWQFFRWGPRAVQFMLVVVSLIWLFQAYLVAMIERGLNWARITFLVLFVLGMLFSALSIGQALERTPLAAISAIAQSVLQAIAMVLVFLPSSNPWYRGVRS